MNKLCYGTKFTLLKTTFGKSYLIDLIEVYGPGDDRRWDGNTNFFQLEKC